MKKTKTSELLRLVERKQTIRPRDLDGVGIPRNYLGRLVRTGKLQKLGRGLYTTKTALPSENSTLLEVNQRVPKAVICLLSALRFHEIGTQLPSEVWIAVDVKAWHAWHPIPDYPNVRIVRFSGRAMQFGVQEHRLGARTIRVFSPAKTVADCFKFRNKIGTDVAIEALRECYREKKASIDDLWEAAKICRVTNVIRPYLESLH
ncbi:MAG: type IV toxin-antitoxin system AbiEi family antitoxin domain-containing protein [Acidobacteriia bacterium]|nr:type IV toxin-antitoxin system AbiEi family antitoxin domain-containing protein [Terriglobia bacterium]